MNLKNLKIGIQLKLGFTIIMLLIIVVGIVASIQADKIQQQVDDIYNHPLKVRRAIGSLTADILSMRLAARDLMLASNFQEKLDAAQATELAAADALQQFKILYEQYLGPRTDIDEAYQAFISWNTARSEEVVKPALSGAVEEVKKTVHSSGSVGIYREKLLQKIRKIDDFAHKKGDALHVTSIELHDSLARQLIILVATIIILAIIISYLLLRNIRTPLQELTDTARSFHEGNMAARSRYESDNEFGLLSASFNRLAESIQANTDLSEKTVCLARVMLSEDDAKMFFRATLSELATLTGSQMAAVYLLSEDKRTFDHFASIGLGDNAKLSFAVDSFEGEFGAALASRQTQHLKSIPEDTRFAFHTTAGTFIPREIITIPIANSDIVAVISLATVGIYGTQVQQLIDNIHPTLNSRIEGVLAYRKVKDFSAQLEQQNRELDAQKTELTAQSTELMAQNIELEMQKNQLDEASRLKTNFLSNMSHELRTPLNSVIALSGVLNRRLARQIPAEEYSYLEVIERNGKHLLSLINDILDISRIEAGREEIDVSTFDANKLIAETADMIRPQSEQKKIELLHLDPEANLQLKSDSGKCRHIIQNLIANAVKFTEAGTVEVRARQSEKNIEITVTDTGIGIEETHLPHIFDEFRQADSSTSRRFGGTGLGLAIAKKFAVLLGGTITVTSIPGAGSAFTLILPLSHATENRLIEGKNSDSAKYSLKQASLNAPANPAEKTILLVEDSEPAIIQLKDILAEDGYQILVARDGGEALGIIAETVPDAMILDLMMPGVDGFEVLRIIREAERTAHIPVLILTAKHITKEELQSLKRNNVHQLIQKGDVNRAELQHAVEKMVCPVKTAPAKPEPALQTIEGTPVILVVEDNPDNMITVKALLADHYAVIEAVDGLEGVKMAKQCRPNLILMDIALPGMDGIEAFKHIRDNAHLRHIPVIALTASAMVSDRETILAHGFDAYIAKPIDEKQLFKSIKEALYGE